MVQVGAAGKGASGGEGGLGGLHHLYRYEWLKQTFDLPMNSRHAEVLDARKTYNLSQRADSGRAGASGKDGDDLHPVNLGRLVLGIPAPLPCTPRGIVEYPIPGRAVDIDQVEAAVMVATIARWSLKLLDAGAAADEAATLRQALEQLLSRIEPSPLEVKSLTS